MEERERESGGYLLPGKSSPISRHSQRALEKTEPAPYYHSLTTLLVSPLVGRVRGEEVGGEERIMGGGGGEGLKSQGSRGV